MRNLLADVEVEVRAELRVVHISIDVQYPAVEELLQAKRGGCY